MEFTDLELTSLEAAIINQGMRMEQGMSVSANNRAEFDGYFKENMLLREIFRKLMDYRRDRSGGKGS